MANRTGTNRGETLVGTAAADTISARGGNDTLRGLAGNDRLLGEEGDDRLLGGDGNDRLEGGIGLDSLFGEGGNDVLLGGLFNDFIDGGAGIDTVDYGDITAPRPDTQFAIVVDLEAGTGRGANGPDTLRGIENASGSRFRDLLIGGAGDTVLVGREGNDILTGENGSDRLVGGSGSDALRGDADDDRLEGGAGDDFMVGGSGDDRLIGSGGNDQLAGGDGSDALNGGAGEDMFFNAFEDGEEGITRAAAGRDVIEDFVRGDDTLVFFIPNDDFGGEFGDLDSNGSGTLDDGDRFVSVERVSHGGSSRLSTVVDFTDAPGSGLPAGTESSTVIFGVTALTAADIDTVRG